MRPVRHLVSDIEGLKRAVGRGMRFYRTACNDTAKLEDLVEDRLESDCGTCQILSNPNPPKREDGKGGEEEGGEEVPGDVDLSEFEAIGAVDQEEVGDPSSYPEPESISFSDLCTRLGIDPRVDPKGRLGNLPIDVRSVLTKEQREAADPILKMVSQLPMAAPLVETVYRLCHRLAWYEGVSSFQLPVASQARVLPGQRLETENWKLETKSETKGEDDHE